MDTIILDDYVVNLEAVAAAVGNPTHGAAMRSIVTDLYLDAMSVGDSVACAAHDLRERHLADGYDYDLEEVRQALLRQMVGEKMLVR